MSYVPPPAPEEPTREPRRRREVWYGVGVALLACLVLPLLGLVAPNTLGVLIIAISMIVCIVGGLLVMRELWPRRWRSASSAAAGRSG